MDDRDQLGNTTLRILEAVRGKLPREEDSRLRRRWCATLVSVRFMGLDDRLGTVSEGKIALLVLVRGNPEAERQAFWCAHVCGGERHADQYPARHLP